MRVALRVYSVPAGASQPLRRDVHGQPIGSDVVAPGTSFTLVSLPFPIVTAGPHTFRFAGTDGSGDKSTFIDDVAISQ